MGRVIAETFGLAGAKVAIVGLEEADTFQAAEEMKGRGIDVLPLVGNITVDSDVQRIISTAVERFGRLDVLVNNAGRTHRGWIMETPPEEVLDLFQLNLLGTFRMTQAALPHLLESANSSGRKDGVAHVINIGSLAAKSAARWVGAYPITKFAVAAFSQQLRLELGGKDFTSSSSVPDRSNGRIRDFIL